MNTKLESNYLEKIKNVDCKDLKRFYENEYKEYEKYFKQKNKEKITELTQLKDSCNSNYLRKQLEYKINYLKERV